MASKYCDGLWKQAKAKCRLNMEEIELAKKLGINPKSLIKNIPNKSEPWKAPVGVWLREIDAERQKKANQKQKRKEQTKKSLVVDGINDDGDPK